MVPARGSGGGITLDAPGFGSGPRIRLDPGERDVKAASLRQVPAVRGPLFISVWGIAYPSVRPAMETPMYEFSFDGMPVGIFKESDYPRSSGRYCYEPYRGLGHYEMQKLLRAGGSPRCYYESDGVRVSFTIRSCPEYGVLVLCDFESTACGGTSP